MLQSAKRIAENASFQAFVNSFVRETDLGTMVSLNDVAIDTIKSGLYGPQVMEIRLPKQNTKLLVDVHYESIVGRHTFGVAVRETRGIGWQLEEPLAAMIMLIQELHLQAKASPQKRDSCFEECLLRMIESCQTMAGYIEERMMEGDDLHAPNQSFIESEQSLLYGHWLHPTPKSRQGMAYWQHQSYAPELQGSFQLHYFLVHHTIVEHASMHESSAWEIVAKEVEAERRLAEVDEKWLPFPMHPLQAQFLLKQPHVKEAIENGLIRDIGSSGKLYTATSSIRTVVSESGEWMFKFSIPVKVTNSLRSNKRHELRAGILVAKLLAHAPWVNKSKSFKMIADPAFLTVRLPGMEETGFETIIRENPFRTGGYGISSIAALVQDPLPGCKSKLESLIRELAEREKRSVEQVSVNWFTQYIKIAVWPLVHMYDEWGLALEAHQQNSLLDVSEGYPSTYYYRDNQGYYLADSYKQTLLSTEPELKEADGLFYEDAIIENRFTYYLMMNQVFSLIYRFGVDGLLKESTLVEQLRFELEAMKRALTGAGKQFVTGLLEKDELAFKANLLTRFHDVDELAEELEQAVYVTMKNPLYVNKQKARLTYVGTAHSTV